jgi:hypothetical protein
MRPFDKPEKPDKPGDGDRKNPKKEDGGKAARENERYISERGTHTEIGIASSLHETVEALLRGIESRARRIRDWVQELVQRGPVRSLPGAVGFRVDDLRACAERLHQKTDPNFARFLPTDKPGGGKQTHCSELAEYCLNKIGQNRDPEGKPQHHQTAIFCERPDAVAQSKGLKEATNPRNPNISLGLRCSREPRGPQHKEEGHMFLVGNPANGLGIAAENTGIARRTMYKVNNGKAEYYEGSKKPLDSKLILFEPISPIVKK